jgi:hypothetical protein
MKVVGENTNFIGGGLGGLPIRKLSPASYIEFRG